jgi:hypothetical protein
MRVNIHRHTNLRMAQQFLYDLWVDTKMPYRFLCNGENQENVEVSPDLTTWLFCYRPLHKIRHGISFCHRDQSFCIPL